MSDNEEPSAASAGSLAKDPLRGNAMNDSHRLPYGYENNVTCTTDKTGRIVINWPEGCRGTVISRELLDDIVDGKNNSPRWIPVTERLPDRNTNVLVWIPSGNDRTFIASLDEGGMWFSSDPTADAYSLGEDGAPTHWMQLPAPPTDAK